MERPHTFSSSVRLNRRLSTTNPPGDLSPSDRTNLLFTMSKQHAWTDRLAKDVEPAKRSYSDEEAWRSPQAPHSRNGGARRDRTDDLMLAKHALSQLSYGPMRVLARIMVGPERFELSTSRLSSARSNQLSYGPMPLQPRPRLVAGPRSWKLVRRRKRNEDGGSRAFVTRSIPVVRPGSTVGVPRGSRRPWKWTDLRRWTSGS